jgi:hypothetical protein
MMISALTPTGWIGQGVRTVGIHRTAAPRNIAQHREIVIDPGRYG